MRRLLIAIPLVLLAVTAPAFAGGWATVGMSSTPAGVEPGTPWTVELTILQHGRTPLEGLSPSITIRNGDARATFPAAETGEPGVYRASVVFPAAGRWTYQVDDGFISERPHLFAPVQIGAPATAATDDGGPSPAWLIPAIALLAVPALLLRRPRRTRRLAHPVEPSG